jgi:hypothetical protein
MFSLRNPSTHQHTTYAFFEKFMPLSFIVFASLSLSLCAAAAHFFLFRKVIKRHFYQTHTAAAAAAAIATPPTHYAHLFVE